MMTERASTSFQVSGLQEAGSGGPGLGITYEKCVGGPGSVSSDYTIPVASDKPLHRVSEKWTLLREAGRLLPEERVASCSRALISKAMEVPVWRSNETGKAFFGNLKRCGSVWQCPVCAGKITEARRKDLQAGLANWAASGKKVFLLTLTIPHHAGSDVKELCSKLLRALKFLQNRSHWRAFRSAVGLRGTVRALEVTYGNNGAHVHIHMLLFCDGKRNPHKADVLSSWQKACESAGLPEPNEHGVDIRDGTYAAKYVGKWGLDCELTKAHVKKGNGSGRTPWDLLRASVDGDSMASFLFVKHAAAFFRKRQLVWSRGLRALLGLVEEEKTDEEIANEREKEVSQVMVLSMSDWIVVLKRDKRGELLLRAETGGEAAVQGLLFDLRKECRDTWAEKHWRN